MSPPTREEFRRSRLYLCALSFHKRNEQRLKNIRDILEKGIEKQKRSGKSRSGERKVTTWTLPESDERAGKNRISQEDSAILSADKNESGWVHDKEKGEYTLTLGGVTVMKLPADMFDRLMGFQRDALKWMAGVAPIGGILGDDMGTYKGNPCSHHHIESQELTILFPTIVPKDLAKRSCRLQVWAPR